MILHKAVASVDVSSIVKGHVLSLVVVNSSTHQFCYKIMIDLQISGGADNILVSPLALLNMSLIHKNLLDNGEILGGHVFYCH